MKDSTVLMLAGAAALGFVLMPDKFREQVPYIGSGGGGGVSIIPMPSPIMPDLGGYARPITDDSFISGMLAQIQGLRGDVEKAMGAAGAAQTAMETAQALFEKGQNTFDMEAFQKWLESALPEAGGEPPPDPEKQRAESDPTGTTDVTPASPTISARDKAGAEFLGMGGWLSFAKIAPMIMKVVAPRVAPKLVAGISGIGVPVAIAWTAADILTTGYELITGKNVAGQWLGWGEVIFPENTQTEAPAKLATSEASQTPPEAPSRYPEHVVDNWQRRGGLGGASAEPAPAPEPEPAPEKPYNVRGWSPERGYYQLTEAEHIALGY